MEVVILAGVNDSSFHCIYGGSYVSTKFVRSSTAVSGIIDTNDLIYWPSGQQERTGVVGNNKFLSGSKLCVIRRDDVRLSLVWSTIDITMSIVVNGFLSPCRGCLHFAQLFHVTAAINNRTDLVKWRFILV